MAFAGVHPDLIWSQVDQHDKNEKIGRTTCDVVRPCDACVRMQVHYIHATASSHGDRSTQCCLFRQCFGSFVHACVVHRTMRRHAAGKISVGHTT